MNSEALRRSLRTPLFWSRALFVVLCVIVTFLTLTPNPDDVQAGFNITRWLSEMLLGDPQRADKIAHFMAYGALGASACWAQLRVGAQRWGVVAALAIYGAALEGLQGLGGVRMAELSDALANSFGAVAGFAGAVILAFVISRLSK